MKKKLKPITKKDHLRRVLENLSLSKGAIKIYVNSFGKDILSLQEIRSLSNELSESELQEGIKELIQQNLFLVIKAESTDLIEQYKVISPFSIIDNGITMLKENLAGSSSRISDLIENTIDQIFEKDTGIEIESLYNNFQKFQESLNADFKSIREEIKELGDNIEEKVDTSTSFLDKYKEGLVNVFKSQMTGILIVLLQFKADFEENLKAVGITDDQWVAIRDIVKDLLAKEIHDKTLELGEMLESEFNDIKTELKDVFREKFKAKFEQQAVYIGILNIFMSEMQKLNTLISKKKEEFQSGMKKLINTIINNVNDNLQKENASWLESVDTMKGLLSELIQESSFINISELKELRVLRNSAIIKEVISHLLDTVKKELLIITPHLEKYVPLEKLALEYEEKSEKIIGKAKKLTAEDIGVKPGPSIKELESKLKNDLEVTKRKAVELKGYELSHSIADIMSTVSEINPNSAVLEGMKNWLNRLLVIRKLLDQSLRMKLLEDLEKWGKLYKQTKKEEEPEEIAGSSEEPRKEKDVSSDNLQIKICSSTKHSNKHAIGIKNTSNMEYKKIKGNKLILIKADDSYALLGVLMESENENTSDMIGVATQYPPLIELVSPLIETTWQDATYAKNIQISDGMNVILDNINDFSGKEIAAILQNVLNLAFKKAGGLSLSVLEIKVLVNKLKGQDQPIEENLKRDVVDAIKKINKELKLAEVISEPRFRKPGEKEEGQEPIEEEVEERSLEIESPEVLEEIELEPEKINALFELFFDKMDELKGVELGKQVENLIEIVMQFQGFEEIVNWKKELKGIDANLIEPIKDKLKVDFLKWKNTILSAPKPVSGKDDKKEFETSIASITEKEPELNLEEMEYTSPALKEALAESEKSKPQEEPITEGSAELIAKFDDIEHGISKEIGPKISKKLQDAMDIILETVGYSMDLKAMKDWITKFRGIRKPLSEETQQSFKKDFSKWRTKYAPKKEGETEMDYKPTFSITEETPAEEIKEGSRMKQLFQSLSSGIQTKEGYELTEDLQEIADIVLNDQGAVAARGIRPWISKLRSIREPLEEDIKSELMADLEKWKEKFL